MSAALSKLEFQAALATRFHDAFRVPEKRAALTLSTGISELDSLINGIPRGALTEIFGPASSGRTSLLYSMLHSATTHDEICALIDINNVFAPTTAAPAGIDFDRFLWVRCDSNLEHGFKATDLILHAGGFGLVVLDMGDVSGKDARRIISSWWYRFRRTVENKPTAIVVVSAEACTRSCASLTLELNGLAEWVITNGQRSELVSHASLLRANSIRVNRRRPIVPGLNQSEFNSSNYF
jgi:hypothetical protein